jgi:predicted membrane protein (TIGR00267 family)
MVKVADIVSNLIKILRTEDAGSIIRRFFINTLFDSTFMLLGIIVGAAFAADASLGVIMVTMLTSSLALGISTGVSVYEAESLEHERKISNLEKAMLTDLDNTVIDKTSKSVTILAMGINFLTPLFSCGVTISPFIFVALQILEINVASWISVASALMILFGAGVYLGRIGKKNPWIKGLRMTAFGILAFIIGILLDSLV